MVIILTIGMIFYVVVKIFKSGSLNFYFIWYRNFTVCSILVTMFFLIFTSFGQAWGRPLESHYLAMGMCTFFPLVIIGIYENKSEFIWNILIVISILAYTISCDVINYPVTEPTKQKYIAFLEQEKYTYGYTNSYWYGSVVAAATDRKVEVAQVEDLEMMIVREWGSIKSYKERVPEFIILTGDAYQLTENEVSFPAKEVYRDDVVVIMEFSEY